MAGVMATEACFITGERSAYAEDLGLVQSAQAGDLDAYAVLFARYQARIYNIIYGMIANRDDAADLTQETFVKAYRALGSLRDGQAFYAWLYRIAINLCRNHRRGKPVSFSLDEGILCNGERVPLDIPDTSQEPAQLVETHATATAVRDAIATLSPDHREVLVLHHLEGLPVEHIARVVGVPVGTVKSRLSRGRASLKRVLRHFVES